MNFKVGDWVLIDSYGKALGGNSGQILRIECNRGFWGSDYGLEVSNNSFMLDSGYFRLDLKTGNKLKINKILDIKDEV